MKHVYPLSAALLSLSIATWLLWTYPHEARRQSEELAAARTAALADYKTCTTVAEKAYDERWSSACKAQSEKDAEECRIDVICISGSYSKGSDSCALKPGAANIDAAKVRERCAAVYPFNADCDLPKEGVGFNTDLQRHKTECRSAFDMHMYGLEAHHS
jgi:hypothetical protein